MAYDEKLADRVRQALTRRSSVEEREMFGGLAFMVRGHMCCGLAKDKLMVRVDPDAYDQLRKNIKEFPDAQSVAALRELGVRSVLLHPERADGTLWAGAAAKPI